MNGTKKVLALHIQQCDQIRLYLKGLGDKFLNKSSPNNWRLLGYFLSKLLWLLGHFILTSGRTAQHA